MCETSQLNDTATASRQWKYQSYLCWLNFICGILFKNIEFVLTGLARPIDSIDFNKHVYIG